MISVQKRVALLKELMKRFVDEVDRGAHPDLAYILACIEKTAPSQAKIIV